MQDNAGKCTEENTVICERKCTGGRLDSACDFYLPDYMGDVKRIMVSEAVAMNAGYSENEGGVSFAVVVGYSVIYLDGENRLTEAQFTSDLEFSVPCDEKIVDATLELDVPSLQIRAAGARKLSAKATVSAEVGLLVKRCMPPETLPAGSETVLSEISLYSPRYLPSCEYDLAEQIAFIEDVSAEELEVIFERAEVLHAEVSGDDTGTGVEAELLGRCLIRKNGESYAPHSGVLKLSAPLPEQWEGQVPDCLKVDITSVSCSVNNATSDEDMKVGTSVVIGLVAELSGRVDGCVKRRVVRDAFIPGQASECTVKSLEYDELCFKRDVRERVSFDIMAGDIGLERLDDLLLCTSKFKMGETVNEDGELYCEGEVMTSGIALSDGRAVQFKRAYPVRVPLKLSCDNDVRLLRTVELQACEHHPAQDRIGVVCTLKMYIRGIKRKSERAVADIHSEPCEMCDDFGVCIYYPRVGDTLFSVAKKYRVGCEGIAERNGIAVPTLSINNNELKLDIAKPIIIEKTLK
ncbi:MAG: LysM peptidoglycan-binding domain-containing protein [Clostridia bacterium]|nr:LysM peptidoglycan-binding domain-containing protein [Clostridia bacterium]